MKWILAAVVLIGLSSNVALACSCRNRHDEPRVAVSASFERASIVFIGRVESKEKFRPKEADAHMEYERTQFYVVQSWKGEKATRVYVETSITCCMCGYLFEKDRLYLVFASPSSDSGYYATSLCSGTKPLDAAQEDVAVLDEMAASKAR